MKAQTCIYCGAKAVRWCDLVLGFENDGGGLASLDTPIFRCDAPLCIEHAAHKGNIFFSGSPEIAGMETIDHCVGHEQHWSEDLRGNGSYDTERWQPISREEAERMRYRHRCMASGPLKLINNPQANLFASRPDARRRAREAAEETERNRG